MAKATFKKADTIKYINQYSMAKYISETLNIPIGLVTEVIELEQKLTMQYVRDGYKVTKKNYVTFTPIKKKGFTLKSSITGKSHKIPDRMSIKTTLGQGFKVYVSGLKDKMPEKICRFVDHKEITIQISDTV
jgi:hypothetical protein